MEALEAALNAQVEKSKGQPWYDYLKSQAETFLEFVPQEDNLRAQANRRGEARAKHRQMLGQ